MESVIIITSFIVIILAGAYFLYRLGEYLYELYIEYFTVDANPDAPEQLVKPTWQEKLETGAKTVEQALNQVPEITKKLISVVFTWKRKRQAKKTRLSSIPRTRQHAQKPIRKNTPRRARWKSSEEYYDMRNDILGIDPADRGSGRDVWDAKRNIKSDTWDTKRR